MNFVEERRQPATFTQHISGGEQFARILIVDDDPAVLWSADQALRRAGYRTTTAFDGHGALGADRRDGPFDLLITDLYMPFMNGAEIARRLRQRTPDLRALYLMVSGDQLFPSAVASQSDDTFIDKASGLGELLTAVANLLRRDLRPSGGTT
ncbi:MAG: response regulator [Acidobacteriia bacterium]|nr:response regulator [Terriglobia bacterium]